jgi:hypothetical protein
MENTKRACGSRRDGGDDFVVHGARKLAANFLFSTNKIRDIQIQVLANAALREVFR